MALKQKLLGTASALIHLTELPDALRRFVDPADPATQKVPGYQRLWEGACSGLYPSEKHGGRRFVRAEHVPDVARAYGLSPPPPPKRARAKRAASSTGAPTAGRIKPPAKAKPARAKRASSPSSMDAAV